MYHVNKWAAVEMDGMITYVYKNSVHQGKFFGERKVKLVSFLNRFLIIKGSISFRYIFKSVSLSLLEKYLLLR